jgi:transcriptional regulator with XRE-family HTH domain
MLTFGEILNVLLKQHNLKAKEVAEKIGVSESYFSRLKKGLIMPQNFELIQNIFEAINLPEHEKRMLINAYKVTKLGEDIMSIEETIQKLCNISFLKKQ